MPFDVTMRGRSPALPSCFPASWPPSLPAFFLCGSIAFSFAPLGSGFAGLEKPPRNQHDEESSAIQTGDQVERQASPP